jgi:hypothetical protein
LIDGSHIFQLPHWVRSLALWIIIVVLPLPVHAQRAALVIVTESPSIELIVEDSEGRRLGYSERGGDLFEIPQGSYFRDSAAANDGGGPVPPAAATMRKTAYIASPHNGDYKVTAIGTALGPYKVNLRSISEDGSNQESGLSGVAEASSHTMYRVVYSQIPGNRLMTSRLATFDGTTADIRTSFRLALIDNKALADTLLQKLETARRAGHAMRNGILKALKTEVTAQAGKHVRSVAVQALIEDVDSLLGQNE